MKKVILLVLAILLLASLVITPRAPTPGDNVVVRRAWVVGDAEERFFVFVAKLYFSQNKIWPKIWINIGDSDQTLWRWAGETVAYYALVFSIVFPLFFWLESRRLKGEGKIWPDRHKQAALRSILASLAVPTVILLTRVPWFLDQIQPR